METSFNLETLLKRYSLITQKRQRFSFYFDTIRPVITSLLKKQIEQKVNNNILAEYSTLVLILGPNPNPALILANSFTPHNLVVFYPDTHKKILDTLFVPHLDTSINSISTIPLEYTNHDINYNTIDSVLSKLPKTKTLCDITSGKKILSFQLGLLAQKHDFDICYIDSHQYIQNSDIPVPGSESLYIYTSESENPTTIKLRKTNQLLITYIPRAYMVLYIIDTEQGTFKHILDDFSQSSIEAIKQEVEIFYKKINSNILSRLPVTSIIDELSETIASLFRLDQFSQLLEKTNIELSLDIELAGIPWEIPLHKLCNVQLPIPRIITKNSLYSHRYKNENKYHGILLILGSTNGIQDFYDNIHTIVKNTKPYEKVNIIEAKTIGYLQKELVRRRYNSIIYYGHSEINDTIENSGWVCQNGEIFTPKRISILSSKPPKLLLSLSCNSAWCPPFSNHTMAYYAIQAGITSFIGTNFLIDYEKSMRSINEMLSIVLTTMPDTQLFKQSLCTFYNSLASDDILKYNFIFYSQ